MTMSAARAIRSLTSRLSSSRLVWYWLPSVLVVAGLTSAVASPLSASSDQDDTDTGQSLTGVIDLPPGSVITGDPGTAVRLASVQVAAENVGKTCRLVIEAANQVSVHPGNDLVIRTGGRSHVITGVEDAEADLSASSVTAELGDSIVVLLRLGPDGVASFDPSLSFTCPPTAAATGTGTQATVEKPEPAKTEIKEAVNQDTVNQDTGNQDLREQAAKVKIEKITPSATAKDLSSVDAVDDLKTTPIAKAVAAEPTYTG